MSDTRQSLADLANLTGQPAPEPQAPAPTDSGNDVGESPVETPAPVQVQSFTPHIDCGDNVVVINADKVRFTGKKLGQKVYYKHTGFAGGIKGVTAGKVLEGQFPERVLEKAVERMVPRGPLGRQQMRNLRIFKGAEHDHAAQNPEVLDVASMNRKNKVGA